MPLDKRTVIWLVSGRRLPPTAAKVERRGPPRDAEYRAWIRTLPCAGCGARAGIEAAHTGSDGGTSQKASDYSCVPLCRYCHTIGKNAYHRIGRVEFERITGIVFAELVNELNAEWRRKGESATGKM